MESKKYNFNDGQKYIIEQAKIEVEHNRSWPTKVMAFYAVVNFVLIGPLIARQEFALPCGAKVILTLFVYTLSCLVVYTLTRNHLNYLTYRNLQINFQKEHLQDLKKKYELPDDWFESNEVRLLRRFHGWGLYFYLVIMVFFACLGGDMVRFMILRLKAIPSPRLMAPNAS